MKNIDPALNAELRASFIAAFRAGVYIAHSRTDGRLLTAADLEAMSQDDFDEVEFRPAPQWKEAPDRVC